MRKIKRFVKKLAIPFIWIKNYFLCLRYPFLKSRNVWTDKFLGYGDTLYEWIPEGWRKAFGKQLIRDLRKALKQDGILKDFRFHQIKEKYGTLRLYSNFVGPESKKVINKYEGMSQDYCICCGKPAEYETRGWIEFLCKDCFDLEVPKNISEEERKEYYDMCKIKEEKEEEE